VPTLPGRPRSLPLIRSAIMPQPDYRGTPAGLTAGLTAAWRARTDLGPQPGYGDMADTLRTLLDQIAGARPSVQLIEDATSQLRDLSRQFAKHQVDEGGQVSGRLVELAGRGQVMAPAIAVDEHTDARASGHVTFGRFYLGGNGAVHGGAIPLAFDELMGRLANTGRSPSRTAYLHVNYRSITPIDKTLRIEASFHSEQGRKRVLRGVLRDGSTVCADAEGLFVALRPGQP
jgi:acyl-coenzyme A thioesterase PaaI-like protein